MILHVVDIFVIISCPEDGLRMTDISYSFVFISKAFLTLFYSQPVLLSCETLAAFTG